jgi:hypothetical protein
MDTAAQDVREMLQMAALLKGAAARAVFRDCATIFLGVAELLERRVQTQGESGAARPPVPPPQPLEAWPLQQGEHCAPRRAQGAHHQALARK